MCNAGSASDDVMAMLANQDTASMLSFTSSTNTASSSSNYRSQQQQQLGTKVHGSCLHQPCALCVLRGCKNRPTPFPGRDVVQAD